MPVDLVTGQATWAVAYSTVGSHGIMAAYSGQPQFTASASLVLAQAVTYGIVLQYDPASAKYKSGMRDPITLQLDNFESQSVLGEHPGHGSVRDSRAGRPTRSLELRLVPSRLYRRTVQLHRLGPGGAVLPIRGQHQGILTRRLRAAVHGGLGIGHARRALRPQLTPARRSLHGSQRWRCGEGCKKRRGRVRWLLQLPRRLGGSDRRKAIRHHLVADDYQFTRRPGAVRKLQTHPCRAPGWISQYHSLHPPPPTQVTHCFRT